MLHLPFKRYERQCNSLGQWDLYPKPRDFFSPFEVLSREISLFTILMPEQDQLCAGPGVWKSRSYAFLENQQVNFFLCICYSFLFSCILNGKPAFCSHLIAALLLSKYWFIKERLGLRPRGKKSKHDLFHDLQTEKAVGGDGGDVLDLLGVAAGMCLSRWSMSFACFFCPLAQTLCFCISELSHRFILVEIVKGVVFQDLWISMGSDKWSFIDQAYIYNAKGQSQMLPVETEDIVARPCLCPCNCQCLTNKKWKQKQWTDPKGN